MRSTKGRRGPMLSAAALMVIGVMLSRSLPARRLGATGLVPLGVGLAASRSVRGTAAAPAEFLAVNAGLLLLGVVLVAVALVRSARGARDPLSRIGVLAGAAGALAALRWVMPPALEGGPERAVAIAAITALIAAAAAGLARRSGVGDAVRRRVSPPVSLSPEPLSLGLLAAGAAAVALGPHLGVVFAGAVLSAWAAWLATPVSGRPAPAAAVLVLLLVGVVWWLLGAIAGPEGLAVAAIPSLPLSPAAEQLIAPLLLAAAWALAGVWPWRQPLGGVLTAPLGALLLVRVGLPAVPAGLEHWRAAAVPVLLVGLWYAALTGRLATVAVGGAFLGLASVEAVGVAGAWWLLACGLAIELLGRLPRDLHGTVARCLEALVALGAAWGALAVLEAGLRTEVVYSVLGALAALVALRRGGVHIPASYGKSF